MHHDEFFCRACRGPFSKIWTSIEPNEGKVVCPWCGKEVELRWFYLVAAEQSA